MTSPGYASALRTLAAVQTPVRFADPAGNLAQMKSLLTRLVANPPFLTVFPECFVSGYCYSSKEEAMPFALTRDDAWIQEASQLAQSANTNIVFGFVERDGETLFNSAALATRDGQRHFYRKVHLPYLGVDRFVEAGNAFPVFTVEGLRVGIGICYDCSFPESIRCLALGGADVIALPTNWPVGARATADYIPPVRALENRVWFVAANRIGAEGGFQFVGTSRICDPGGNTIALAKDPNKEEILTASFDPDISRQKLQRIVPGEYEIDRIADRRPETYTDLVEVKKPV